MCSYGDCKAKDCASILYSLDNRQPHFAAHIREAVRRIIERERAK